MSAKNIGKLFLLLMLLFSNKHETIAQQAISQISIEGQSAHLENEHGVGFAQFKPSGLTSSFFMSLIIDIVFVFILIRLVYYPIYSKKDFFFTFFLFNIIIFVITYLFNKVELSTGAAFGIFAVFSLLRYRTEDISAKDMTYLFIVIALGLVNSISRENIFDVIIIDSLIVLAAYVLDGNLFMKNELVQTLQYENLEMIKSSNQAALIEDLKSRTGLNIHKISISKVDFVKKSANVKVYYYE